MSDKKEMAGGTVAAIGLLAAFAAGVNQNHPWLSVPLILIAVACILATKKMR